MDPDFLQEFISAFENSSLLHEFTKVGSPMQCHLITIIPSTTLFYKEYEREVYIPVKYKWQQRATQTSADYQVE